MLRLVAIMLVIPMDTSECERIFSLMNDIKVSTRASLGQLNLLGIMTWQYYGKELKPCEVPVREILAEFRALVADDPKGRYCHTAALQISYEWQTSSPADQSNANCPPGLNAEGSVSGGTHNAGRADLNGSALEEATAGNLGAGGFYDRFGREPGQP